MLVGVAALACVSAFTEFGSKVRSKVESQAHAVEDGDDSNVGAIAANVDVGGSGGGTIDSPPPLDLDALRAQSRKALDNLPPRNAPAGLRVAQAGPALRVAQSVAPSQPTPRGVASPSTAPAEQNSRTLTLSAPASNNPFKGEIPFKGPVPFEGFKGPVPFEGFKGAVPFTPPKVYGPDTAPRPSLFGPATNFSH